MTADIRARLTERGTCMLTTWSPLSLKAIQRFVHRGHGQRSHSICLCVFVPLPFCLSVCCIFRLPVIVFCFGVFIPSPYADRILAHNETQAWLFQLTWPLPTASRHLLRATSPASLLCTLRPVKPPAFFGCRPLVRRSSNGIPPRHCLARSVIAPETVTPAATAATAAQLPAASPCLLLRNMFDPAK
jgi:hypothetical protein